MVNAWLITSSQANKYKQRRYLEEALVLGIRFDQITAEDVFFKIDASGASIWLEGKKITRLPDLTLSIIVGEEHYPHIPPLLNYLAQHRFTGNSITSYRLANDKFATYQLLSEMKISFPATVVCGKGPTHFNQLKRRLGLPFLVKPNSGSKGEGVSVIHSRAEYSKYVKSQTNFFIAQQFLEASKGADIRLLMLEGKLLGAIERQAATDSFLSNSAQGSSASVVKPSTEMLRIARTAVKKMELFFGSVDFIFDGEQYVVCEVNASPGFEQFEATTKINVARQVLEAMLSHR